MTRYLASVGWVLILSIAVTVVVAPRFNRSAPPSGTSWASHAEPRADPADAAFYADVVLWLRGEPTFMPLTAPFTRRPGAPALAAVLPAAPMTALNLVNWASLLLGAIAVYSSVRTIGHERAAARIAGGAFVASFPVFYYGAIGYIDPVLIACIAGLTLAICRGSMTGMILALFFGCLTKETMAASLPAAIAALTTGPHRPPRVRLRAAALIAAAGTALLLAFSAIPEAMSISVPPSIEWLSSNLRRPRTWGSLALTFGPIGCTLVAVLLLPARRAHLREQALASPLALGIIAHVAVVGVAFTASVADGRSLWPCYPYALGLIGLATLPQPQD